MLSAWIVSKDEELNDTPDHTSALDYYCENFVPLYDIDIRIPYYGTDCKRKDDGSQDMFIGKQYHVFNNPPMEYVYALRDMLRKLRETCELNTFGSGVGYSCESSDDLTNYYGPEDSSVVDNKPLRWDDNFVKGDKVILCAGCFLWSSFVYPEYIEFFEQHHTTEMAYLQWLDEHEDDLIIE